MCTDDEVRLAVLVDHLGACLEPEPPKVLRHQPVGYQTRTPSLDHWKTKNTIFIFIYWIVFQGWIQEFLKGGGGCSKRQLRTDKLTSKEKTLKVGGVKPDRPLLDLARCENIRWC